MTKCVRITCTMKVSEAFAASIQKYANKFKLEGALQIVPPDKIRIVACGVKDNIDDFVDLLYKEGSSKKPFELEVEPFLKDKDYRGVFRILA